MPEVPNSSMPGVRRRFNSLLPSAPVHFPFEGDFALLYLQAAQDRVLTLGERQEELLGDLTAQLPLLRSELQGHHDTFQERWRAHESWIDERKGYLDKEGQPEAGAVYFQEREAEFTANQEEYQREGQTYYKETLEKLERVRALNREIDLRIISYCVLRIGALRREKTETGDPITVWYWPFDGEPPDPQQPADWAEWPDKVLDWMAGEALAEVRRQIQNPNSSA